MEQKRSFLNSLLRLLLLAAASVLFLAVCSLSTTPLLHTYVGQDAAFFRLVGQGMKEGLLPYRDFFDMKGPYLFLMEYLGQLFFPGRLGAFALQAVCLFVSLLFAQKVLDLAVPERGCPVWAELLLLIPSAVVLSYTMTDGNLTEELSLPFLMPCLYLVLKYLGRTRLPSPENQDHPIWYGFFYGVIFGVMALIRITNAALIGAILLTVTCNLLKWKRFRNFFANAAMFLLGTAAGLLPGCLWALGNGILGDMLAQVFLFGFAYSDEASLVQKLPGLLTIWPCLLAGAMPLAVLLVYRVRDWKHWLLFFSGYATLLLAAAMGNAYVHYFVLALPLCVYGSYLLAWQCARRWKKRTGDRGVCLALSAALFVGILGAQLPLLYPWFQQEAKLAMYRARTHQEDETDQKAIHALAAQIPEGKTVYVYGLPSCSAWYLQAGKMPPMRYCDWQPHYIQLDPEIGAQIEAYLTEREPDYVVTPAAGTEPASIAAALEAGYTELDTQGDYILWEKE